MRNGLNISNLSEVVHELRDRPLHAQHRYRVRVLLGPDRFWCCPLTAHTGTIRVPRDFQFDVDRDLGSTSPFISPIEYLLPAIAGCVMTTYLYGASAKGITLTTLATEMTIQRMRGPEGENLDSLRYIIDVDADCDDTTVRGIARSASRVSPNHRTVLAPNELTLQVMVRGSDQQRAQRELTVSADKSPSEFPELVDELQSRLDWQYGTQLAGDVWSRSRTGRRALEVDQPKQYFGIDKAPNPQEYLLAALGMDIVAGVARIARSEGQQFDGVRAELGGNLDLRGVLQIDPSAEVRVHPIGGTMELEVPGDPTPWLDYVEQALHRSALRRVLCNPKALEVEVRRRGKMLVIFPTDEHQITMDRRPNQPSD